MRSYSSLRAAIRGVRLDVAEVEADGYRCPLEIAVRYEHYDAGGSFKDSEVVALWKRGRFVWVDSAFKEKRAREKLSRNVRFG
jgi:hypothetical protein